MIAGSLRSTVIYQEPVDGGSNPDGSPITTWSDVGTFRAFVRSATGRELIQAQQLQAQLSLVIEHRYQGSVPKPTGRYLVGSRVLNVVWVDNVDSRNRQIKAYVIESVS